MGAVVVAVDREGRVAYFGAGAERLNGYRADEVLGRPLTEVLLPPDEVPAVSATLAQLAAGVVPERFERDWLTRSGQRHRLAFVTTPLTDPSGALEYVVAAGVDVTAERKAQEPAALRRLVGRALKVLVRRVRRRRRARVGARGRGR